MVYACNLIIALSGWLSKVLAHSMFALLVHLQIWNLGSPDPNFTLDAHQKGVNCVDYFTGGDKPYLITGSDDHTAKVCFMFAPLLDDTFLREIMCFQVIY